MIDNATKKVMAGIVCGADVWGYEDARLLRELQQDHPEMIRIGEPRMYDGGGTDQMPYFGAILTDTGIAALAETEEQK